MQTIIELPEADCESLDALSRRLGICRAEAIRRAVSAYVKLHRTPAHDEVFGIWHDRQEDALANEDRIRAEWQRR